MRCVDLHANAGVDLTRVPLVGVGSCRRQSTVEVADILTHLHQARYAHLLVSADSMVLYSITVVGSHPIGAGGHGPSTVPRGGSQPIRVH
jgi:hypothetical protein